MKGKGGILSQNYVLNNKFISSYPQFFLLAINKIGIVTHKTLKTDIKLNLKIERTFFRKLGAKDYQQTSSKINNNGYYH